MLMVADSDYRKFSNLRLGITRPLVCCTLNGALLNQLADACEIFQFGLKKLDFIIN
jgi:hypothetical protein